MLQPSRVIHFLGNRGEIADFRGRRLDTRKNPAMILAAWGSTETVMPLVQVTKKGKRGKGNTIKNFPHKV